MARRYKKRNNDNYYGKALGLLVLIGFSVAYTKYNEVKANQPNLIPVIIAGLIVVAGAFIGFMIYRYLRKLKVRKAFNMSDIDTMDGVKFEYYLADLLRKRGFTDVRVTEKYDLGIDIIGKKGGIVWGIQAKRYASMVKAAAIRQAYTALSHYRCERAMIITNSTYSRPSQTLARETKTMLIDRTELSEWIYETGKQR